MLSPLYETNIQYLIKITIVSFNLYIVHFIFPLLVSIVVNSEIINAPNQTLYCSTLLPDCCPFRARIFTTSNLSENSYGNNEKGT